VTLFPTEPVASESMIVWPMATPPQPCALCRQHIEQADAILVQVVEQGTGREFDAWRHRDTNRCKVALA
jgi:hypothetical protein